MPDSHAFVSPSGAHKIENCPGSLLLEAKYKDILGQKDTKFTIEGTKAHAVAEAKLRKFNKEWDQERYDAERAKIEEEFGPIPKEMDNYTDTYVDIIEGKFYALQQECPDAEMHIEERINMEKWVSQCWGTSDCILVSDTLAEVIDLKYGLGVLVEAEGNPQARLYGLGALNAYGSIFGFDKIRNTIIQVRRDHVSEETLTRKELLDWVENEFAPKVREALSGEGHLCPGDHCVFCTVKPICVSRVHEALEAFSHGMDAPGVIDESQVPGILKIADTAISWLNDIKDYALNQAKGGQHWKGYKLVKGKPGNRKIVNEEDAEAALIKAGIDKSSYTETKMLSIGKLETKLGKKTVANLLSDYIVRPEGSLVLVPESDERDEVSPDKDIFNELINNN